MKLVLVLAFLSAVNLHSQALNVDVRAKSAILYNPKNGAILYQKKATDPHYPASILKVATALYALEQEKFGLDFEFLATKEALRVIHADLKQSDFLSYEPYIIEHDGTMMGIEAEKKYSMRTLLYGLLLVSGNDAANVLAQGIGGSIPKFMDDLNQYLQKKGIHQTRLQNPHGLHHPAQITTAYDMALIAGLAFQNPIFRQIARSSQFKMENGKLLLNTNRLLKEGKYQYPKYIGGKTGYIGIAGYNLVAAAENDGRILIAVLLGCKKRQQRFEDAINLFESAFSEKEVKRLLFSKEHECFSKKDSTLKAKLEEDVYIAYYPSEEPLLQAKIIWKKEALPIKKGDEVGMLLVENDKGIELTSSPIFAVSDLSLPSAKRRKLWLLLPLGAFILAQFLKKKGKFFQAKCFRPTLEE